MKNLLLRQERLRKGLSQKQLADFAEVSVSTVERAEHGEKIRVDCVQRLCAYLDKAPNELGLFKEDPKKSQDDNNQQILLLQKSIHSNMPFDTSKIITLDQATSDRLDYAESIINLSWEVWFASRPQQVTKEVNRLLPGLEKIAHSLYQPIHTLRAKELSIRAHGLLGSVCLDALQNDTSFFHYMQAYKFAEEIHDVDLATTYLCFVGEVLRRQNDQSGALSYMENARDLAINASKATRGHILQLLAYTYGDTGQASAFEHTISEATDLLAFSGEGRDTSQKEFVPFEIYEIRGKINRELGNPLNAIPYLDLAEKSLVLADSVTPRWQALLEISRAQAYCDAGDVTYGIELASQGLIKAYRCHSPHQMNRVRKLWQKLENNSTKNHPGVQDLKNLLYETYVRIENEDLSKSSPPTPFKHN